MLLPFLLCVSLLQGLVRSQDSMTIQKQNHTDPRTTQSCNINNYNSFYAGPNKKLEESYVGRKKATGRDSNGAQELDQEK